MPIIDLHVHSSCSDGAHAPSDVLVLAREHHVNVLSIADLNNVDAYFAVQELHAKGLFPDGLLYLPGLEIPVISEVDRSK